MIIKIAEKATGILLQENIITEDFKDIYQYGMEVIVSTILDLLLVLTMGVVLNATTQGITYFLVLATVRTQAGGYHASSYFRCSLVYCGTFIVSLLMVKALIFLKINPALLLLVLLINTFFIWWYAPVLNNRTMDDIERKHAKKKAVIRCLIWILFSACSYRYYKPGLYAVLADISLIAVFMLIGKRKGGKKNEKGVKKKIIE